MSEEPLRPANPDLFEGLKSALGEQAVSVSGAERHLHSQDESTYPAVVPDLVVWPQSTDDVVRIVTLAAEYGEPITGWGAASSSEGHAIPVRHGIVVDFGKMNRILAVHAEDFQATVQPGVLRLDLEKHLSQYGLFFAPDPGANASTSHLGCTHPRSPFAYRGCCVKLALRMYSSASSYHNTS